MADLETIEAVKEIDVDKYKYGFETMIESDMAPKGLSEEVIRFISAKKEEPEWMLEQRLEAYQRWLKMDEPTWAKVSYPKIDFNDIYYYAAPKGQTGPKSLDEVDPELLATYAKLGIPLKEQEILAGVRKQGEPSQLDEDGGPSYGPATSRSMPCSTRCPWSPPSRRNWPRPASSSARFPKPSASTRNW
jgi:Fe-S cluster assembly protein SufB